ncbi:hypothetical protein C5C18_01475 [Rathayibacter tritici]|uniref:WxL domain-containing protein n=1 Tax=Rathayibacter tritici TaxID=33888 RepID=A0A160KVC0_9MICO|nr:hypothetical protein [Rathayibacter tritici]AND17896.1 hypothetical protein A6122_2787 [Rathayibacter tritici]PPF30551.1 hypothetical protein C5C06_04740 [Rathayibacter tritici]PPF66694.1 hypothetical protein C5C21_08490 [Rathayibacter tritici]PPG09079.1 hypothetical protein C5C18_01475 [Rathayibacter tritici]PPI17849.1 hypothetical protein C5D07_04135 [Rathayibacter tritici]
MNTRSLLIRGAAGLAGGVLLLGVAGTAFAAEIDYGSDDVDVNVDIADLPGTGALSMSVAGTSTTLTEDGSDNVRRQFTGALPTVTVTDTRDAADVPEGAGWYVLGTASDFTSADGATIGAENLGWTPALVDGGDLGLVAAGDQVDTAIDGGVNGVGLEGRELLALAIDSQEINPEGSWSADADLFLRTPVSVDAGAYSSTITLSLFE